ncbi:MAG: tyrosine-type recombinase/integrase [Sphingomonadaceae bacterium]|nr:tyrosine-type recombinase/integrase [Sphingomonadaceae bacterium]
MATGKITNASVEAVEIPATGKRAHLWDDTLKGFGVMVTDKGVRSYIIQYRLYGRASDTRRVTIGKHGSPWTAKKARDRASELLEQVRRKIDPFDAQRAEKLAKDKAKAEQSALLAIKQRLAFGRIADRYIEATKKKLRTWREIESVINRDLRPAFGDTPLPDISSAAICDMLADVTQRGEGAARAAYRSTSAIFKFAAQHEAKYFKASQSPMRDVPAPAKAGKRQRLLSNDELRTIWKSSAGLGWPFSDIVRLLMLTGQRLREVAHATWDEFDLEKREWLIPGDRTKNKLPTVVFLSDQTLAILRELPVIKCKGNYLFTTTGETAVTGFSRCKSRLDAIINKPRIKAGEQPLAEWWFHDLRRTMSTNCQRLGISPEVVDLMQNHVQGAQSGTRGSYQLYRYADERRDGFARWGNELEGIINKPAGENVFSLRGAA